MQPSSPLNLLPGLSGNAASSDRKTAGDKAKKEIVADQFSAVMTRASEKLGPKTDRQLATKNAGEATVAPRPEQNAENQIENAATAPQAEMLQSSQTAPPAGTAEILASSQTLQPQEIAIETPSPAEPSIAETLLATAATPQPVTTSAPATDAQTLPVADAPPEEQRSSDPVNATPDVDIPQETATPQPQPAAGDTAQWLAVQAAVTLTVPTLPVPSSPDAVTTQTAETVDPAAGSAVNAETFAKSNTAAPAGGNQKFSAPTGAEAVFKTSPQPVSQPETENANETSAMTQARPLPMATTETPAAAAPATALPDTVIAESDDLPTAMNLAMQSDQADAFTPQSETPGLISADGDMSSYATGTTYSPSVNPTGATLPGLVSENAKTSTQAATAQSAPQTAEQSEALKTLKDLHEESSFTIESSTHPAKHGETDAPVDDFSAPAPASSADSGNLSATATGSATTDVSADAPVKNASDPLKQVFTSAARSIEDQVLEGTAHAVKNGHRELTIRLNPDNLGEVRINLISSGNAGNTALSARLIASTPESHEALQNQLQSLRHSLEAQGVNVDRISVVMAGNADASGKTGSDAHRQQFHQSNDEQFQQSRHDANNHHPHQQDSRQPNLFSQWSQSGRNPAGRNGNHYAQSPGRTAPVSSTEEPRSQRRNDNGNISVLA